MQFYFSGIASDEEFTWLKEAGIQRFLVDPTDLPNIDWTDSPDVILDSGAYRAFKKGKPLDLEAYLAKAIDPRFTLVVAPDVIGDMDATLKNWQAFKHKGLPLLPVWQWGASEQVLYELLDEAPLVGIGGCVPWMRVDQSKKRQIEAIAEDVEQRERNFEKLQLLCQQFPDRFHVFGLCWVKAIEALKETLYSADSSHWLAGARRAKVIFQNTRTGHLSEAPAGVLQFAKDWDRRQQCVENARAIAQFLGEPCKLSVSV